MRPSVSMRMAHKLLASMWKWLNNTMDCERHPYAHHRRQRSMMMTMMSNKTIQPIHHTAAYVQHDVYFRVLRCEHEYKIYLFNAYNGFFAFLFFTKTNTTIFARVHAEPCEKLRCVYAIRHDQFIKSAVCICAIRTVNHRFSVFI